MIEQLDGHLEDDVTEDIDTEFDAEIEEYLSTGKMGTDPQLWEDLLFYLPNRDEKFLAIEARRQALNEEYGPNYYLSQHPWDHSYLRYNVLK